MTTTPNLLIEHIAANQSQKEVTANTAFDALDKAFCQPTDIALADANLSLSDAQFLGSVYLRFTGTLTAARTITVPARGKLVIVENATTGGFSIDVKTAAGAAITFINGDRKLLYGNGATLLRLAEISTLPTLPYDIGGTVGGAPGAGAVLVRFPLPRPVRFPAGMTGSRGVAAEAATATTVFALRKNGVDFGTMQFAASANLATFTGASDTDFAAGDVLTVIAPNPADGTLADIGFSLAGLRL